MKKIMLFLNCVLSLSLLNAGVSIDTIIETSEGPQAISLLKVGDKIICFNNNLLAEEKSVLSIEEIETDKVVEITTEDGEMISIAADQQLFVPKKWVRADQLSLGDILLKKDLNFIGITAIRHKNESSKLRFIVVEDHHNFLASKNGVLVHNGPCAAYQAYWATKIALYAALGVTIGGAAVLTGGAVTAGLTAMSTAGTAGAMAAGTAQFAAGTAASGALATATGVTTAGAVAGTVTTGGLVATGVATVETAMVAGGAVTAGISGATTVATTPSIAGVAAATAAAIETASLAAAAAAFSCPFTPW